MPRITAIACTGLAVAGLGFFAAAAGADAAAPAPTSSWARTYTLKAHQKKTHKLQLPVGFAKAPGRYAIGYTLYPASGPGFAVGKPVGTKQKPYLGARVVKSSFQGRTVSVTVKTAKLKRAMALEISARGTVAQVGEAAGTPARIAISGVPAGKALVLQFDQDIDYQATDQTDGIPEFEFQGQNVLVDLPHNGIIVGGSQSALSGNVTLGVDGDQLSATAQIPAGATVTVAIGGAAPVAIADGAFSVGG